MSQPHKQLINWLRNTRGGITLSCTEGKLLLTILTTKISKKLEHETFFSKTQAGFRKGQEALAHVFKKAFDRVPHEGVWAKLRHIRIHNDLVEIVKKGLYDSSKIQCRLGDQLSHPFTREIGTLQGCPLSPLLFIIFPNDIFSKISEGIEVPGLDQKKCGIIQYGSPDSLVKNLPTEMKLSEGSIKFMNTYKYLWCWINNERQEKEHYFLEREHAKTLAQKSKKCVFSSLPLLLDEESHLLCKSRLIQTYIMAVGSYGAEWIAMGQKRTCKIQAVIALAMRIAYGHKSTSRKLNSLLLCTELGINPYSIHSTKQCLSLWQKKTTPKNNSIRSYIMP
ncbi:RNA-directed DNA polymerase, Non LTR Retrotransposon [Puccinia sorghi]|uniref:RNA-directed DNA polymerase, Non LTR Retrotransposon n=1 Tax=Puccinia sorghi TaxID=27349 RepID=A0A0L6UKZ3_9BASI|nr:RNA-directed DNA polymerase, Non LTR Retrotransposon [Puccinia sorghi]